MNVPLQPAGLSYNHDQGQVFSVPEEAQGTRDLRLDFIRGLAMFFVIINHLPAPSFFYVLTVERIGVVTGAEIFVVLSGIVLGMVHRKRISESGWVGSAKALLRRAGQLYLIVIVVALSAWSLEALPGMHGHALTTWTDINAGVQYRLFPDQPLANPLHSLKELLLLRVTPWQFNIIGLYVVLLALTPLALWFLKSEQVILLLLISSGFYLFNSQLHLHATPGIFERPFPLLTWQILFFFGLTTGYHHRHLRHFFKSHWGHLTVGAAVLAAIGFAFFALNNPWTAYPYGQIPEWARLQLIPERLFNKIYAWVFLERTWLGVARLANVAVLIVALYAILSLWWQGMYRGLGWLLIPLGQASLYVFIMHLPVVLLLDMAVAAGAQIFLPNLVLHLFAVGFLWLAVKRRFLFRWIPR